MMNLSHLLFTLAVLQAEVYMSTPSMFIPTNLRLPTICLTKKISASQWGKLTTLQRPDFWLCSRVTYSDDCNFIIRYTSNPVHEEAHIHWNITIFQALTLLTAPPQAVLAPGCKPIGATSMFDGMDTLSLVHLSSSSFWTWIEEEAGRFWCLAC